MGYAISTILMCLFIMALIWVWYFGKKHPRTVAKPTTADIEVKKQDGREAKRVSINKRINQTQTELGNYINSFSELGNPIICAYDKFRLYDKDSVFDKELGLRDDSRWIGGGLNVIMIWEKQKMFCMKTFPWLTEYPRYPIPERLNQPVKFDDIIRVEVVDNPKSNGGLNSQYSQTSVSTTKTNTLGMIGRGIVGGVLFGPIGAIVGGATASSKTITETASNSFPTSEIHVIHDYTLRLTINDFNTPNIEIKFRDDEVGLRKISTYFELMISRQNK